MKGWIYFSHLHFSNLPILALEWRTPRDLLEWPRFLDLLKSLAFIMPSFSPFHALLWYGQDLQAQTGALSIPEV